MMDTILNKIADLLWSRLEVKIKEAHADGYRRGNERGYVEGHEDGYISSHEDLVRRVATLYDAVHATATRDAYAEAGAIEIEDISVEDFDKLADRGVK